MNNEEVQIIKNTICMDKITNLNLGDQLLVDVSELGEKTLTVQKITDDYIIVMFDDCVARKCVNENGTNKGGFEKSDLNKWLQTEFKNKLPENIKNKLKEITLPSYENMFGSDTYVKQYFDCYDEEQFILMKERKNRIALSNNDTCWYWLKNKTKNKVSSSCFASVLSFGFAGYNRAYGSRGVRPVLYLVR